jgi:chemotaxis methyl-accepting protein methylase
MPAGDATRHFVERSDGAHVVERIRSMCHFNQMNLLEANRARLLGRVDAMFCRNMLIYLDAHSRRKVIDLFHERLFPRRRAPAPGALGVAAERHDGLRAAYT